MDGLLRDFRHAVRSLARNPGFACVIVLILALGIGANTAVFSIVNALLIRPLGFADPDRLVILYGARPNDLLTLLAAITLLGVTGVVACYLPARRAARVDPMIALRTE